MITHSFRKRTSGALVVLTALSLVELGLLFVLTRRAVIIEDKLLTQRLAAHGAAVEMNR